MQVPLCNSRIAFFAATVAWSNLLGQAPGLPVAEKKPFSEIITGHVVEDAYRYMENMHDASVQQWMKAQANYTRAALDALPGRKEVLDDLIALERGEAVRPAQLSVCGSTLFYTRRTPSDVVERIYVQELGRPERLFLDVAALAKAGTHIALTHFDPSTDCRYVAVGVASGGAEKQVMHLYSVADGPGDRGAGGPVQGCGVAAWARRDACDT